MSVPVHILITPESHVLREARSAPLRLAFVLDLVSPDRLDEFTAALPESIILLSEPTSFAQQAAHALDESILQR